MPSLPTDTHVHQPHLSHAWHQFGRVPVDRVPLLDVGRENAPLETKILAAISQVVRSGRFVMGPECQQLGHWDRTAWWRKVRGQGAG